jgi:hypothetical protein
MKNKRTTKSHTKLVYLRPESRRQIEEMAAELNCSHSEAIRHAVAVFMINKTGRNEENDHRSVRSKLHYAARRK